MTLLGERNIWEAEILLKVTVHWRTWQIFCCDKAQCERRLFIRAEICRPKQARPHRIVKWRETQV